MKILDCLHIRLGWPMWVVQVFGLSGPLEGCRQEQPCLKGSASMSCSSLVDRKSILVVHSHRAWKQMYNWPLSMKSLVNLFLGSTYKTSLHWTHTNLSPLGLGFGCDVWVTSFSKHKGTNSLKVEETLIIVVRARQELYDTKSFLYFNRTKNENVWSKKFIVRIKSLPNTNSVY